MSLKALREGIENKDWDSVIQAFEDMTGEILTLDLDEDIELEEEVVEKPKKPRGRPAKNKQVEKKPVKATRARGKVKIDPRGPLVNPNRPNLFEDMLAKVANTKEDREAREFDKKYAYNAQKAERRESVKKIRVKCSVCGVTKRIYPSEFVKLNENSRYRCNEC